MNVAPGFFHRKIEEQYNQKKSLAVLFPAYLFYLPGKLKSLGKKKENSSSVLPRILGRPGGILTVIFNVSV